MGGSTQEKPKELRATKAGLPLMGFAKGRNFRLALRLIVFGVGSGESLIADWGGFACNRQALRNPRAETISRSNFSKYSSLDESH